MARRNATQASNQSGKKRVVTTREEEIVPPEREEEQEEQEEPPSDLELLVGELGGESYEFAVFRLDPKAARGRVFVGPLPGQRDTFAILQLLQETYGGGTFELRVREPGGTFSHRVTVAVDAPKKVEPPVPPAQQMQEQMSAVINAAMAPMLQLVEQLKQRPTFNFNDLLTKGAMLIPLLGQARAALGLNAAAPNALPSDPLTLLTQIKQMKDTMNAMGLSDREPDAIDRIVTLFTSAAPMLQKAMEAQARRGAVGRPAAAPNPVAGVMPISGVPVTVPGTPPAPRTAPQVPQEFTPYVPMLAAAARAGETVESVGDRILNALPDTLIDPLADALEDGTLVGALLQKPEFNGTATWLNALARYILSALSSEEGDDSEEPAADVSGTSEPDVTGEADGDS